MSSAPVSAQVESPVVAASALAPRIRAASEEIERGRRLPQALVDELARAGLFRMLVPKGLGGLEIDPATMVEAIEEVSRADGSAGWCVMIGATTGVLAAYLPRDTAREIYGRDPNVITGGVFHPRGKATVVDGGYRVSGRWRFASGCQHCSWLLGGSVIHDGDQPRVTPAGTPEARMIFFPVRDVEIIDTWRVSGLRGTGSHDIAVKDVFVPRDRSAWFATDRPVETGALYAFPVFGLLALGIAAVALGIGRRAIDELVAIAGTKTPTGGQRPIAQRAALQADLARAEATLRSGRSFLLDTIGSVEQVVTERGQVDLENRALLRLAATHATRNAADVVTSMYQAGGGTSIYDSSPLQRQLRDIHVVTQHLLVGPATLELAGRVLLGITTDTEML